MSFEKFQQEDARLTILGLLAGQNDWTLNEAVLKPGLAAMGHSLSKDKIRTELAWLQEQGLLKVKTEMGIQVAKISQRGLDIAEGTAVIPGVKRPSPEDE